MIDGLMTVVINLISVQQRLLVAHRKMFDFRKFDGHSLVKASLEDKCCPLRPLGLKNKQNSPEGVHMPECPRVSACVSVCVCAVLVSWSSNMPLITLSAPCATLFVDTQILEWPTRRSSSSIRSPSDRHRGRRRRRREAHKRREEMEEWKAKDQQKSTVTAHGLNLNYSRLSLKNYIVLIVISAIIPNTQRERKNVKIQPHK